MKKIFAYLAMFTAAATFVACENAPEGNVTPNATGKPIEITIGDESRALLDLTDGKTVTWEAGDQVGFFHHVNGTVSATANNKPYTAGAAGATATFTGEATWSGTAEDTHNIYVYYPYRDRANTADLIVIQMTKDQAYDVTAPTWRVGATYGFAYGKADNVEYGKAVEIGAMKQYFGILRLNITNGTTEDVTISKVTATVSNTFIYASHRLNITGDEAVLADIRDKGKTISTTVSNGVVKAGESIDIRLVVSPNDYSGDTFNISIESDKGVHPAIEFTGGNIAQGGRASKDITLAAVPTSSYKIGDIVDNGVLFWMSDDKKTGKVVCGQGYIGVMGTTNEALKETFLSLGDTDGAANMTKYKKYASDNSLDFASSFPAPYFCDVLDGDWYLPAREEMQALFAAYVGRANWSATSDLPSKTGSETGDAWVGTETARTAFNTALSNAPVISVAAGSTAPAYNLTAFTSDNIFALSSSETSTGANARVLKFNIRYETTGAKWTKSTKRITRCIKVVDLTE